MFIMKLSVTESSLKGRIDNILPYVAKPARYTGGELNSIRKPPEDVSVRIALAFPDTYEVGMSNLGLRILYHILNSLPWAAAERVFAPAIDMEDRMRAASVPLFSLESSLPISVFDIVGFSLAYEMSYTTVLNMLDLAGIPLYSHDRTDAHPVVIAGGHCATNPEPMADYIDAFVIGDGEEVVVDLAQAAAKNRGNREAILKAFSEIDGVYVSSIHTVDAKVRSRVVYDLGEAAFPDTLVIPFTETVHDRVAVEVMRGCSRGCRFCQAGMITRPVRERPPEILCRQAETLIENTGYEEIALTSLSSADYSSVDKLVHTLINRHEADGVGISLPSLRADAGCVALAADIQRVRKSGLTFAPEAGTQRLRNAINKNVTEDDLLGAVEAAVQHGWRRIKLYFMIGLPEETREDLDGIANMVRHVIEVARKNRGNLTLNITISPFVPKPHTPFQWRAMDSIEELEDKIAYIRPLLRGKSIQLSWHDPGCSRIEAALARGDRRVGKVVYEAWKRGGKFEQDKFDRDRWDASFEAAGLDISLYANRRIPHDEHLPWDHIDTGVSKEFLIRENEKSTLGEATPDCRFGECSACGVGRSLISMLGRDIVCPPQSSASEDYECEPREAGRAQEGRGVLFTFAKTSELKWIGHLDIQRVFERAIRMSGSRAVYTQGFNPRIKMSIASAMPLGATADNELITIFFEEPFDIREIVSSLNRRLPDGLKLKGAVLLPPGRKGPAIAASEYEVGMQLPDGMSVDDIQPVVDALMERDSIKVERGEKRDRKVIDIRPGISKLEVVAGSEDGVAALRMFLPHMAFTVKPLEVFRVIKESLPDVEMKWIYRLRLVTQD